MKPTRLIGFAAAVAMCGLGVAAAFGFGALAAQGGTVELTARAYGELWPEYWLMFASVGATPFGLYVIDQKLWKN